MATRTPPDPLNYAKPPPPPGKDVPAVARVLLAAVGLSFAAGPFTRLFVAWWSGGATAFLIPFAAACFALTSAITGRSSRFDVRALFGVGSPPPFDDPTYRELIAAFKALGVEDRFPALHHFARSGTHAAPPDLRRFLRDCDRIQEFRLSATNLQTVARATAFIDHLRAGLPPDLATEAAWREYPLT